MSASAGFFDQHADDELPEGLDRDGRGRPLLIPGGGGSLKVPYTRASGLAEEIADQRGVHKWELRYLARGIGMRPDLAELAAAETYNTGFDMVDIGENRASGRRLDEIIKRAHDAVKIHERANHGTAVHQLTEPGNTGVAITERAKTGVASFKESMARRNIRIGGTEIFVANDAVMAAGTFDHLVWHKDLGIVIADKKTGKMNPHEFCIQLAVYANAEVYDVDTDQRSPLESLTKGQPINRDVGLVIWIHDGETEFKLVDLEAGWEAAQRAAGDRDYRARRDLIGDF